MTIAVSPGTHVSPDAYVDEAATVHEDVVIGAHAWIGPGVVVGRGCVIQPGAVIGSDGFGFERGPDGEWVDKPHPYGVVLGEGVHVGANACIDRGSWRDTYIYYGTRIDNLVHVAHNCVLGRGVVVVAQAELSGSVVVGGGAWISPRACVKERLRIGARALVGMGAVVIDSVPADVTVAGNPARVINASLGVRDRM